ncbi:hypothetical protein Tco_1379540, partial [Tanacetum coccineum]
MTVLGSQELSNLNTAFEEVNTGNMEAVSPSAQNEDVITNPTLRIHNAHPQSQILGDPNTPVQTISSLKKITKAHALVSYIQAHQRSNHKDQQHCLFACFLSQFEPRKVSEALEDGSWVEAMQEELLQFKLQQVWVLVDLPNGAKVIGILLLPKSGGWDQFGSNIATALICLSTGRVYNFSKLIFDVKLVKKVKKLEGFLKRRNLVLTDSEDEEPEAQGRKSQADPQDSSIQGLVTPPTTKPKLSQRLPPISFEATKASLKRFGEELQTKTPKRLKEEKDDEVKDEESTKKSGKRRKQMARKGMNTNVDENDSEDSDKV